MEISTWGIGTAVAGIAIRWAVPAVPKAIAWAIVAAGIVIALSGLPPAAMKPPLISIVLLCVAALCVGGAVHFYVQRPAVAAPAKEEAQAVSAKPTINAPGGIVTNNQSGGTNTVINRAPPARHIALDQEQKFASAAPAAGGAKLGIRIQDGSSEGRTYAREVARLLEGSGWTVIVTDGANTLSGDHRGLVIETAEPTPAGAGAIAAAFDKAGIAYKIVPGPWPKGADAYRLVIWPIP